MWIPQVAAGLYIHFIPLNCSEFNGVIGFQKLSSYLYPNRELMRDRGPISEDSQRCDEYESCFQFLQLLFECKLQDVSSWHLPAPALLMVLTQKEWLSCKWILCIKKNWYPWIMETATMNPRSVSKCLVTWPELVSIWLLKLEFFLTCWCWLKGSEISNGNCMLIALYLVDSV